MSAVQHNCGMISNSICNFPWSALSAFHLETENERKVIEKHIFYFVKKDLTFYFFFCWEGEGRQDRRWEKKLIILGVLVLGANPKRWHNSILYN